MNVPSSIEQTILQRLGTLAKKRTITVSSGAYIVFEAPSSLNELEVVAADAPRFRALDVRLFLGRGGTLLVAGYQLPLLDVIEYAQIGTHNNDDSAWQDVRRLMASIEKRDPFDIVFADEAGLDARFVTPPSEAHAREYDRMLLDAMDREVAWTDSYLFMLDRAIEAGVEADPEADPRGGGKVAAWMVAEGRFRLWWD